MWTGIQTITDIAIMNPMYFGSGFVRLKVRRTAASKCWQEVLKTVQEGGFDVLGHIDFPKRYYGEIYYTEAVLNEIFLRLVEKEIILEINTSSEEGA